MLGSKRIIVLFFVCILFKYSKSETKDDCVDGKSFWSEQGVHEKGACVGCIGLAYCPDQQEDRKRCENSCHPKPKKLSLQFIPSPTISDKVPSPAKQSATPTLDIVSSTLNLPQGHTNTKAASPTSSVYKAATSSTPFTSTLSSVLYSSTKVILDQERRDEKQDQNTTLIISLSCGFGILAIVVIVVVVSVFCKKREKIAGVEACQIDEEEKKPFQETEFTVYKNSTGTGVDGQQKEEAGRADEEQERKPSQEAEPAIYKTSSNTRLGGIQDSGDTKTSSALNLDEKCM